MATPTEPNARLKGPSTLEDRLLLQAVFECVWVLWKHLLGRAFPSYSIIYDTLQQWDTWYLFTEGIHTPSRN